MEHRDVGYVVWIRMEAVVGEWTSYRGSTMIQVACTLSDTVEFGRLCVKYMKTARHVQSAARCLLNQAHGQSEHATQQ